MKSLHESLRTGKPGYSLTPMGGDVHMEAVGWKMNAPEVAEKA